MAATSTSLSLPFSTFLRATPQPQFQPRPCNPKFPRSHRLSLTPALSCAAPLAAVPDGVAIDDIVEKDWSFLNSAGSHLPRALAAGALSPASRVLAVTPTASFVVSLLSESPCELLVAAHESLYVLAGIKEEHDQVRCFHLEGGGGGKGGGVVEAVPERFNAFDAVFVCYLPGMGVSTAALLKSLAKRCSKGARVVIFLDQGRQNLEQHRREHPDVVSSDLPSRSSLEKAAAGSEYEIVEFVDEPTLNQVDMDYFIGSLFVDIPGISPKLTSLCLMPGKFVVPVARSSVSIYDAVQLADLAGNATRNYSSGLVHKATTGYQLHVPHI